MKNSVKRNGKNCILLLDDNSTLLEMALDILEIISEKFALIHLLQVIKKFLPTLHIIIK